MSQKERILIMDDEPLNVKLPMAKLLSDQHNTIFACNVKHEKK